MKWSPSTLSKLLFGGSIVLSAGIMGYVFLTLQDGNTRIIRMEQLYALIAVSALYLFFIVEPFYEAYPNAKGKKLLLASRETLIIITWYFGLLHTLLVFFGQLGGFAGLVFLSSTYLFAISLSFTALLILCYLSIFLFKRMMKKMPAINRNIICRLLTVVGLLVLIHALLVGTHFSDLSKLLPQAFLVAFFLLAGLESLRFDSWLKKKYSFKPRVGVCFSIVIAAFLFYTLGGIFLPGSPVTIGIHGEHLKSLTKEQGRIPKKATSNFAVSFLHPQVLSPDMTVPLSFVVTSRANNRAIENYDLVSEKYMHVIVVDDSLTYFNHIHPTQKGNNFTVETTFPHDGSYHIYSEFQPKNAPEQLFPFRLQVGATTQVSPTNQVPDTNLTKVFGAYSVTMSYPKPLLASEVTLGEAEISFTVRHNQDQSPVTTLKPYLGSFGHLVLINQQTYDYIHVHPGSSLPPGPSKDGGPTVSFYPLGLNGSITPGVYRFFAQFNPDGRLFTADFTVRIE